MRRVDGPRWRALLPFLLVVVFACSKAPDSQSTPAPAAAAIDLDLFCRHWIHSFEEQADPQGPDQMYRPNGFKEFPPSWFRKQYVFGRNGDVQWLWLSPSDAHEMRSGTWRIDPQRKDVLTIHEGDQVSSYRVLEVSKDLLHMQALAE